MCVYIQTIDVCIRVQCKCIGNIYITGRGRVIVMGNEGKGGYGCVGGG